MQMSMTLMLNTLENWISLARLDVPASPMFGAGAKTGCRGQMRIPESKISIEEDGRGKQTYSLDNQDRQDDRMTY